MPVTNVRLGSRYRRNYAASPMFSVSNSSAIAASATWIFGFATEKPTCVKYLPFNYTIVSNMSANAILFYPNQSSRGKFIPPSSILTFDKKTIPALSSVKIVNTVASEIAIDKIEVSCSREAYDTQNVIEDLHKKMMAVLHGYKME